MCKLGAAAALACAARLGRRSKSTGNKRVYQVDCGRTRLGSHLRVECLVFTAPLHLASKGESLVATETGSALQRVRLGSSMWR